MMRAIVFFVVLLLAVSHSFGQDAQVPGLRLLPGFKATKVVSDELATNIYSITVGPSTTSSEGELFVSGPGYINVLLDKDDDGVFDSVRKFANGPRSGVQGGMAFDGSDLLCTGDGALLRFADKDQDGVADGAPKEIFKIKTGGEHDAHSIRRGPDGWWYLLAGNGTPILPEYFAGYNSPVKDPRAGFLMRISPDWKTKEIFCHGFRNAYDFDFNSLGQVFVYDSDGERDITLPWYRGSRVFRMRPGDDAGWVAAGWKRPSYFPDMPIEIGDLGRGSPTGVVNCQSTNFPQSFHDSIFVADWTFGRVVAFRKDASGQYDRGTDFAIADGQFGFAVTDLDFDSQGRLLVSVGGRGTEGAIYRIEYVGDEERGKEVEMSSADAFIKKSNAGRLTSKELVEALKDSNQKIGNAAVEALVGRQDILRYTEDASRGFIGARMKTDPEIVSGLKHGLSSLGDKTAFIGYRVVSLIDGRSKGELLKSGIAMEVKFPLVRQFSVGEAVTWVTWPARNELSMEKESEIMMLIRTGQLALGDCKADGVDQMFVGYTADKAKDISVSLRKQIAQNLHENINLAIKKKNLPATEEYGRLAAMLGFGSVELHGQMADLLEREGATVPQEIHWLICLCQSVGENSSGFGTAEIQSRIAKSLAGLNAKIESQGLVTDRNFYPRLQALAKRMFKRDPAIAKLVAKEIKGRENDVYLFEALPDDLKNIAIVQFGVQVSKNRESATIAQLNVLARHPSGAYNGLLRGFSERPEFRGLIVGVMARDPFAHDRPAFLKAIGSADLTTVKNSAIGLRRLFDHERGDELIAAYQAMLKLAWDKPSISVRDQLMMLIEKHTDESFGYRQRQNKLVQREAVDAAGKWIEENYSDEYAQAFQGDASASIEERLKEVDWASGDPSIGKEVYSRLQCAQCHEGGSRLGPRLEGLSKRFGRADVFRSIMVPNEEVPMRYRALVIESVDGLIYRGSVVYEAVDGVTLQLTNGSTVRINKDDIESRVVSNKSLMPEGLLNDASAQGLADLFAFLKEL